MITLSAGPADSSYPIHIEPGLIGKLSSFLAPFASDGRLILVSDRSVWTRYRAPFCDGCTDLTIEPIVIAPGEKSKSWAVLRMLVSKLLNAGANRDTTIIAFGGGVVGDLVGFAASILHRGCGFIQVPTTLLSQVDSSVGGKTGINTRHGKNQVGSFHVPSMVLIDPCLLENMKPRQLRSGYAELLKIALIGNPSFFDWLERHAASCLALDLSHLSYAIGTAVKGKISLIDGDEHDRTGQRMLLNFGHSFGHAIEAETGFRVPHGEAVALGMRPAFQLSVELGLCNPGDERRVASHLSEVGLPTRLGNLRLGGCGEALGRHFASDKKVVNGRPRFIVTRGIGRAYVDPMVSVPRVLQFLRELQT